MEKVWKENPDFTMGDLKLEAYIAFLAAARALDHDCAQRVVELSGLRVQRDDKFRELQDLVVRFRRGMISHYGSDSAQYEQAGGTRASARKTPNRKAKPDLQPAQPHAASV